MLNLKELIKLNNDLLVEIKRVKFVINNTTYTNDTAFCHIIRKYRIELKGYQRVIQDDITNYEE